MRVCVSVCVCVCECVCVLEKAVCSRTMFISTPCDHISFSEQKIYPFC